MFFVPFSLSYHQKVYVVIHWTESIFCVCFFIMTNGFQNWPNSYKNIEMGSSKCCTRYHHLIVVATELQISVQTKTKLLRVYFVFYIFCLLCSTIICTRRFSRKMFTFLYLCIRLFSTVEKVGENNNVTQICSIGKINSLKFFLKFWIISSLGNMIMQMIISF